jgi:hypothetical protein
MACCADCEQKDFLLDGLMGATLQQAADFPVWPGARFQFGYNIGYDLSAFAASELAGVVEGAGLAYDAGSYKVAGWLNPFVTVEGSSVLYWDSAIDFCNAVRNELQTAGYPLQVQTVQCNVENQSNEPGQAPVITPVIMPSDSSGGNVPRNAQGGCSGLSVTDSIACNFGISTSTALLVGAGLALVGLVLIKR